MSRKFQALLLAMMIGCASLHASAAPADDAQNAYQQAIYARQTSIRANQMVLSIAKPLAERSDRDAERIMGRLAEYGMIAGGNEEAIRWFTKAADQGDPVAKLELAALKGEQIEPVEKRKLVRAAAEQGEEQYQFDMGTFYDLDPPDGKVDRAASFKWFLSAADQGNEIAASIISRKYATGEGVAPDYVQAYMWLAQTNLPAMPGAETLDSLSKKMSSAELARAQKLAAEWKPAVCRKKPAAPCLYANAMR